MDRFMRDCLKHIDPFATEADVRSAEMINEYDILFEFKNGKKYIYDSFAGNFSRPYDDEDITEEQWRFQFRTHLRKLMNRHYMTQSELAERIGTTQPMISRYITGEAIPSCLMLHKIAKALNCSMDDFFYKHY